MLEGDVSSLERLEARWRAMLEDPSLQPEALDWSDIRGKGCG